jgi:putative tryptophan/tyrosine transport system substrate-binding protein
MTQSGHSVAPLSEGRFEPIRWALSNTWGRTLRRREFIKVIVASAVGWPLAANAQVHTRRVAALVGTGNDALGQSWITAFRQKLRDLGWSDRDIQIEVIWGGGDIEHIRASAADLVRSKPDVILVYTVRVLNEVRRRTNEIPVVFIATNDPVGLGIVKSLAHPGGNLTGFTLYEVSIAGKLVELLKEMVPNLARVALLFNPNNSSAELYWPLIQKIAKSLDIIPVSFPVRDAASIREVIGAFVREPNGGIVLPNDATTTTYRDLIVELAARYRLPVVYSFSSVVAGGGLISYGPDTSDLFIQAASYVDRILKGAKPAHLPVQAPTKFTLAVNVKTAKAIGLTVPPSVIARADEVIE